MDHPDGVGSAMNPSCGDEMRLAVRVLDGTIREARFQATGCAATLAAGSAVALLLEGLPISDVSAVVTPEAVEAALGGLPAHRRHASILACQATSRAIRAATAPPGLEFA